MSSQPLESQKDKHRAIGNAYTSSQQSVLLTHKHPRDRNCICLQFGLYACICLQINWWKKQKSCVCRGSRKRWVFLTSQFHSAPLGWGWEAGSSVECSPASSLGAGIGTSEPGAGGREAAVWRGGTGAAAGAGADQAVRAWAGHAGEGHQLLTCWECWWGWGSKQWVKLIGFAYIWRR